jgi:uncharacterized protein (TIGR02391 family)
MNREEAFQQITEYWALVEKADQQPLLSGDRRAVMREVNKRLPAVNKILPSLAPDLRTIVASKVSEHLAAAPKARRALGILGGWEAMTVSQQRTGEPVLPMSMLDPVVSDVALSLWLAGKYRQAVNDAATSLNAYAQSRIGRHDISDKALMTEAFSEKAPEAGKPRLRCPGNPETETVRSQMEGARAFAVGTFQAIRNPAHHMTGDWNPVLAFHHLTALSQLAYWFRNWNVTRYMPPAADYGTIYAAIIENNRTQAQTQRPIAPPAR